MPSEVETDSPERLFRALLERWNSRDEAGFAALFEADGHCIGFDGTEMHGPEQIRSELGRIFADHETARYVATVRDVRLLERGTAVLRAVVGMVPPGKSDLNPDVNAVQTLVATRGDGAWAISLLQSTPARYHGRPDAVESLTAELGELL